VAENYDCWTFVPKKRKMEEMPGLYSLGCIDSRKGSAFIPSALTPQGDILTFDFVAHEMGQSIMGPNHTFVL